MVQPRRHRLSPGFARNWSAATNRDRASSTATTKTPTSSAYSLEAFTYLLFGNTGAILIDTGATPEAAYYPLPHNCRRHHPPLVQHPPPKKHPAYPSSSPQAKTSLPEPGIAAVHRPSETTLAPTQLVEIKQFHKLASWPNGTSSIDLGGRVIDVIPTPGSHKDGITFYDRYNCFLTGDLCSAGTFRSPTPDRDYVLPPPRLRQWTGLIPVKWIMGGHIEVRCSPPGRASPASRTIAPSRTRPSNWSLSSCLNPGRGHRSLSAGRCRLPHRLHPAQRVRPRRKELLHTRPTYPSSPFPSGSHSLARRSVRYGLQPVHQRNTISRALYRAFLKLRTAQ